MNVKVLKVCGYVCKLLDKLFVRYVSVAVLGCKELCMHSVINERQKTNDLHTVTCPFLLVSKER